jgi:hypothetical protein
VAIILGRIGRGDGGLARRGAGAALRRRTSRHEQARLGDRASRDPDQWAEDERLSRVGRSARLDVLDNDDDAFLHKTPVKLTRTLPPPGCATSSREDVFMGYSGTWRPTGSRLDAVLQLKVTGRLVILRHSVPSSSHAGLREAPGRGSGRFGLGSRRFNS